jgi:cation/acetate symporter
MVALAFAIAASANFPALLLSIFWSRCTTAGACASMWVGTLSTVVLIWLSPTLQIDVLGGESAWFPLRNPAVITIPLAFFVGWAVSLATAEAGVVERFARIARQMHLGHEESP